MKKTYELPWAEMQIFGVEDVITSSAEKEEETTAAATIPVEESGEGDVSDFESWQ